MNRYLLCFVLGISMAQARSQFSQADSSIRNRIYRDICVLASDSLQGRRSGTAGEIKAYKYIISRFREAGIQPMGTDSGSFLQEFPLESTNYSFKYKSNHLKVNGRKYTYYEDFGPTSLSADGKFSGQLLIWNEGLPGRSGIPPDSVKPGNGSLSGRIVLYDLYSQRYSSHDTVHLEKSRIKKIAQKFFEMGAEGIIFWDNNQGYFRDLFHFGESDTLQGPVLFVTRETGRSLSRVKNEPMTEIEVSKPSVIRLNCHNVIGYLDNGAPNTVILGAHYDHMGVSRKNEIRYGADDNASGTATILELARFLSVSGDKRNNYLFIAFSGEEQWLVGSTYFCSHPTIDLNSVNFMFNFDMVGRLGCEGNRITAIGCGTSRDWKKVFSQIPDHPFRIHKLRGAASFSDHYEFYRKGIPIAYITTGLHYDYHTPRDIAARINYDGMVSIIRYSEDFIRQAGESGKITYRKVPGWYQFTSNASYFFKELDYILNVGTEGAE